MKRLILIIVAFGTINLVKAQNASEVLSWHFEESGQAVWDQIQSVIVDGRWVTKEYKAYTMRLTCKQPNKVRLEGFWYQKKYIEATNGKTSWIVAPWKESNTPEPMTDLEELVLTNAYNIGSPLKEYEKVLQYDSMVVFKGEKYLKFTFESAEIKKEFYLGPEDYRLYWEVIENKSGIKNLSIEKLFEKYKSYNGLLVPASVRIFSKKYEREFVFDDITLGAGAPNKIFELPSTN